MLTVSSLKHKIWALPCVLWLKNWNCDMLQISYSGETSKHFDSFIISPKLCSCRKKKLVERLKGEEKKELIF